VWTVPETTTKKAGEGEEGKSQTASPGEELTRLSCLLPRKRKQGRLYQGALFFSITLEEEEY